MAMEVTTLTSCPQVVLRAKLSVLGTMLICWLAVGTALVFTLLMCFILAYPHGFVFWLRLCVATLLKGKVENLLVLLGMKCSSWSRVNVGTSHRATCCPAGDITKLSVQQANCMAARIGGLKESWV